MASISIYHVRVSIDEFHVQLINHNTKLSTQQFSLSVLCLNLTSVILTDIT